MQAAQTTMRYLGNNPVGLALTDDPSGELRDQLLQQLADYQGTATQALRESSAPALYQRHLAAVQCATTCAALVREFHAVCNSAAAGSPG
ncbi:hypothetical protein [Aquabacterium sp. OR-4]|uniref:hypothetical protein n=1 Tax=Aquabacterium sp. OR-4 TaxID=2978127 RepID=UPI0021B4B6E9|nr:hypothetical protein [Aquabacterium sp. OR-4]MDT7836043.1 hypothetical protein [Aquabacterium sp. OR-4]